MDDAEVRARIEAVEQQLDGLDERALATVGAVVDLYGEALRRIAAGASLTEDELVSHLLLLHDAHPVPVETRVAAALDEVRPYLGSHGGDVELVGIVDGVAQVRLTGTCNGCASSTVTLTHAIEEAIMRAAPELERIEADGVAEPKLLQIGSLTCPTELQA